MERLELLLEFVSFSGGKIPLCLCFSQFLFDTPLVFVIDCTHGHCEYKRFADQLGALRECLVGR